MQEMREGEDEKHSFSFCSLFSPCPVILQSVSSLWWVPAAAAARGTLLPSPRSLVHRKAFSSQRRRREEDKKSHFPPFSATKIIFWPSLTSLSVFRFSFVPFFPPCGSQVRSPKKKSRGSLLPVTPDRVLEAAKGSVRVHLDRGPSLGLAEGRRWWRMLFFFFSPFSFLLLDSFRRPPVLLPTRVLIGVTSQVSSRAERRGRRSFSSSTFGRPPVFRRWFLLATKVPFAEFHSVFLLHFPSGS